MTDLEQFIEFLITCADNAADAMEGADWEEFVRAEERMSTYIRLLWELGIKYNPMTGRREIIPQPISARVFGKHCADCAPEFDCWSNPAKCCKP